MISPWTVGQMSPTWAFFLKRDTRVFDLTGVDASQLSLSIYNANKQPVGTGAGTFNILQAKPAVISYAPAAADSTTAGTFYVRVKVNFGGNTPDDSDYITWVISP